jgi:hypothetical protein
MYNLNPLMRNVLITSNEVIFHAPTKHTLDPRTVEQSIIIAEERFIRPELGSELYDAMCLEKNVLVTSANKETLLGSINASIDELNAFFQSINEQTRFKPLLSLREGTTVNAFEFLSANNLALWKQHLWKLIAECVMVIAFPEAYIQFGTQGVMHTVAPMNPLAGAGDVSPDLRSVKWMMDKKLQDRIDPLIQSMHAYLCGIRTTNAQAFPLYTKYCACGDKKESKRSDVILGIYNDNEENCGCRERRTYY